MRRDIRIGESGIIPVINSGEISKDPNVTQSLKATDGTWSYSKKLINLLEQFNGSKHLIILQGTPDPDAISSALALGFMGEHFEIESTILCFHNVSHHENRALVKRLGIKLVRYTTEFDLSQFKIYSIVDSQRFSTPIDQKFEEYNIRLLAFVDHHREDIAPPPALFLDIRQNVNSTAVIFCEYLKEMYPNGLIAGDPEHVRLATALMHGIRSDTSKFNLAGRYDFEMSAFISPCVDPQVIELIERRVLTPAMVDMFEKALVNRKVHDNFILSDVGFVRGGDRDGIPQVAEFMLTREGTDTVLIFGIVDEKFIDGSFRTRSETISPDEFIKGFLGSSPESGRYYGGGNIRDRGGFQIPLGFFGLHEDRSLIYSMARQIIEKSFLEYIGREKKTS